MANIFDFEVDVKITFECPKCKYKNVDVTAYMSPSEGPFEWTCYLTSCTKCGESITGKE